MKVRGLRRIRAFVRRGIRVRQGCDILGAVGACVIFSPNKALQATPVGAPVSYRSLISGVPELERSATQQSSPCLFNSVRVRFRHANSTASGLNIGIVVLGMTLDLAISLPESMITHREMPRSVLYSSVPAPRHLRAAGLQECWRRTCLRYLFAEQGASGNAGWRASFISEPYFRRA